MVVLSNLSGTMQAYRLPATGGDVVQLTDFEDSVASACFLKFVLVTNGVVGYSGSSTMVVTTNQVSQLRSLESAKYSRTTARAL